MQHDNTRNTIIFIVCAVIILIGYQLLVLQPAAERRQAAARAAAEQTQTVAAEPGTTSDAGPAPQIVSEREALARSPRVPIQTGSLTGSVSLVGGRIDHLYLNNYDRTLNSEANVELLRPEGAEFAFFAHTGWRGENVQNLPGADTRWVLRSSGPLTPANPVVMTHDNGAGLTFTRTIAVDEQYLFTITDRVDNRGGQSVTLAPYGSVQRRGIPRDLGRNHIIHEGAIGVFDGQLRQSKYGSWADENEAQRYSSRGGWVGITDKYWLTAFIPQQDEGIQAQFRTAEQGGVRVFETVYQSRPWTIAPGRAAVETTHLFAGAKRNEVLEAYGQSLGTQRLNDAIDWGMFWFLTKPIFIVLEWFYGLVGNFGVAILLLTIVVKLILFPLANKAYESMSRMRNLQPKMEEIKKKHGSDPAKQQQEIMALYQKEKINPLAGCLPLLIQMPIFYALYKVLFVTIEMRHAPFILWIQDLSARDPTTVWTLFGLIPWNPASVPLAGGLLDGALHIGVLPLLYGLTMWLQQAMNPPAPDPTQRQIFALLPFVFTFIMAPFAAGLILYWAWSNVLTIIQQYVIMHRFKAENPIDTFIDRFIKKKPA